MLNILYPACLVVLIGVLMKVYLSSRRIDEDMIVLKAGPEQEWTYHLYPDIFGDTVHSAAAAVSIVVHGDYYNLWHLPHLMKQWAGPIEIVVYVETEDVLAKSICFLDSVLAGAGRVTVHLVTAHIVSSSTVSNLLSSKRTECGNVSMQDIYNDDEAGNYANSSTIPYPSNLLRNVGRNYSRSKFHLVLDMDVLPNTNCYESLRAFVHHNIDDLTFVALVLPVFEVTKQCCKDDRYPETKADLRNLVERGASRVFYSSIKEHIHSSTQNDRWLNLASPLDTSLNIAYWVQWQHPYEPFFVQHRNTPIFPQQFVGYGYNRLSQLMLLDIAGTKFGVVDECFLLHCGFKTIDSLTSHKLQQLQWNKIIYEKLENG